MADFFPVPPRAPAPRFHVLLSRPGAEDVVMTHTAKPLPRVFRSEKAAKRAAKRMESIGWKSTSVIRIN